MSFLKLLRTTGKILAPIAAGAIGMRVYSRYRMCAAVPSVDDNHELEKIGIVADTSTEEKLDNYCKLLLDQTEGNPNPSPERMSRCHDMVKSQLGWIHNVDFQQYLIEGGKWSEEKFLKKQGVQRTNTCRK